MTKDNLTAYASALAATLTRRTLGKIPYSPGAKALEWLESAHSVVRLEGGYLVTLWVSPVRVSIDTASAELSASMGAVSARVQLSETVVSPINEVVSLHPHLMHLTHLNT